MGPKAWHAAAVCGVLLAAAISGGTVLAGDDAIPEFTQEFLNDAGNISAGAEIWTNQCRHCHGSSAYPGKAPKLKPSRYKPGFVYARVTNGFGKMPAWKDIFSLEQRMHVVAYVLSSEFSP